MGPTRFRVRFVGPLGEQRWEIWKKGRGREEGSRKGEEKESGVAVRVVMDEIENLKRWV